MGLCPINNIVLIWRVHFVHHAVLFLDPYFFLLAYTFPLALEQIQNPPKKSQQAAFTHFPGSSLPHLLFLNHI